MDLDKSKRSRRILSVAFLAFIALLIILSAFFGNGNKVENVSSAHPNIIFFLVDDLGWQDVSEPFWDKKTPLNEKYNTPNVELLADEGMKFTNAYASCVCSPTRVSGLTGMNAARHRVTNWTLRKNIMRYTKKSRSISLRDLKYKYEFLILLTQPIHWFQTI